MTGREDHLLAIKEKIKASKDVIGLKTLRRIPDQPLGADDLPGLAMFEGDDVVVKISNRNGNGYPKIRQLQVIFEMQDTDRTDVGVRLNSLRAVLFDEYPYILTEEKLIGPYSQIPGLYGMQLITSLKYTDKGPF